jgi:hypothetical protein
VSRRANAGVDVAVRAGGVVAAPWKGRLVRMLFWPPRTHAKEPAVRSRIPYGWMSVLVGALAAACGGQGDRNSASESDSQSEAAAAASFVSQFAEALCDSVAPCCMANVVSFDHGACIVAATELVQSELVAPAAKVGATYDRVAGQACIAGMVATAQACDDLSAPSQSWATACSAVFTGQKQAGESCASTPDCAPAPSGGSVTCVPWSTTVVTDGGFSTQTGSVCQVVLPAVVGAPCQLVTGSNSVPGSPAPGPLYNCDPTTHGNLTCGDGQTCQARVGVGDVCEEDTDCVASAYCLYDGGDTSACAERVPIGQPCAGETGCVAGAYCDNVTGNCLSLLPAGAPCTYASQCTSYCSESMHCVSSSLVALPICGGVTTTADDGGLG